MVKNYRQEDGTYLFPMELAGKKCEEDRMARNADVTVAKREGLKVDFVKFGYSSGSRGAWSFTSRPWQGSGGRDRRTGR